MDKDFSKGVAFVDGDYVPVDEARISLLDLGFLRSDANQDTVSVWRGSFFRLEDHLDRFQRNIARLRMTCPCDRGQQRQILHRAVALTGFREAYVQMLMTRGRLPTGSRDIRLCRNNYVVFCLPYIWIASPERQHEGLDLAVSKIVRVPPESVDPTIKHYHWLDFEMSLFDAYDRGADTCVLVDREGNITEGPGFNIFVVNDGRLSTPGDGVLCADQDPGDRVGAGGGSVSLQHGRRHHAGAKCRRQPGGRRHARPGYPQVEGSLLVEARGRMARLSS
jgi:branched-chain amino acid aminotransferase